MFGKNKETTPDVEFFTVFDSKTKSYAEPFPAPNKDVLLRDFMNAFKKAANEPQTVNRYFLNAEDFSVFRIGQFEFKTGVITPTTMDHVVNLHDLRALAKPENGPRALSPT